MLKAKVSKKYVQFDCAGKEETLMTDLVFVVYSVADRISKQVGADEAEGFLNRLADCINKNENSVVSHIKAEAEPKNCNEMYHREF